MSMTCKTCGYPELDDQYEEVNLICPSCGYQFGYTDNTNEEWRHKWIAGGMVWDKGRSKPPANWDPKKQLLNIGIKI